jgi:hypothetical protein
MSEEWFEAFDAIGYLTMEHSNQKNQELKDRNGWK